MIRIAIIL
ncbi:hypothetical protein VULLAG_LOCUS16347 [Vulpes lagopus]